MDQDSRRKRGDEIQLEVLRRMTPAERLECALRWTALTYELPRSAIRAEHPEWTAAQVDRELGRRITGIDVTTLDWERIRRQRVRGDEATGSPSAEPS